MIDAVIVPRGAELAAIRRGLAGCGGTSPDILDIPMGSLSADAVKAAIAGKAYRRAVIVGVCGLLDPLRAIGDAFAFDESLDTFGNVIACDAELTATLAAACGVTRTRRIVSWSHIVTRAEDKRELGALYFATAVDMESHPVLAVLREAGVAAAVVRVASDDALGDMPNLNAAVRADGTLDGLRLTAALIASPFGAIRLMRGSTRALKRLERLTRALCA